MWSSLWLQMQRGWFRRRAAEELIRCWRRTPAAVRTPHLLAVDLETSSLDARRGEVVSIAWVAVDGGRIPLASAEHILVAGRASVGNSATFHHVRDCERAAGSREEDTLYRFLEAASGRVLVFHHAGLDMAFLDKLSRRYCHSPLLLPFVDTLAIERRRLEVQQQIIPSGSLRLGACRQRCGLPEYPAHNALNDALATAELYLAQQKKACSPIR